MESAIAKRRNQGPAGYFKFHRIGDKKMIVVHHPKWSADHSVLEVDWRPHGRNPACQRLL